MTGLQSMLRERSAAISFAILLWQFFQIKQRRAAHQTLHPLEGGVVGRGGLAPPIVFVFATEKTSQRFPILVVQIRKRFRFGDVGNRVFAAGADGSVLGAQPTGPVACLECFELVSFRAGIQQHKLRHGAIKLSQLLRDDTAKNRSREWWSRLVTSR